MTIGKCAACPKTNVEVCEHADTGELICRACLEERRAPDAEPASQDPGPESNGAGSTDDGHGPRPDPDEPDVCARDYIAAPRVPIEPYVATPDNSSVVLSKNSLLLIAGPSGVGKSLAGSWDLGGRLAADQPSSWLGLRICGGLRVLLLSFEGSDEDTAERAAILPDDALDRFRVWDRWPREHRKAIPLPRADNEASLKRLAMRLRAQEIDVLIIDTGSKFFAGRYDISKGIPEEAIEVIEELRELTGRALTVVMVVHTRKLDRSAKSRDELEEVAGRFGINADAVIVIRRDGDDRGPRLRVMFAKTRKGPDLDDIIAAFPKRGDPAPARLTVVADLGGAKIKEGTEAHEIADWIRGQGDKPALAAAVRVRFNLSPATLRRRADELELLGIVNGEIPGQRGRPIGYGTQEQWTNLIGAPLDVEEDAS